MEETITLQELFKTLRKRLLLIMSIIIFSVTIAGVISFYYLTPVFEASTQILISDKKDSLGLQTLPDIQENLQLINTYSVIIKSPAILSIVIDKLDLNTTPELLYSEIVVNSAENSQVINVTVQDLELQKAVEIANATAEIFQEEIKTLMNANNVNILSPAISLINQKPVKPDPILNMAIAAVIGLMLGVGITFLLEYLDTTMKTEKDIEEVLQLPLLGFISMIPKSKVKRTKETLHRKKKGGLMDV